MTASVARRVENPHEVTAQEKLITFPDLLVDPGDSRRIGARTKNTAACFRLDREISAGVIGMVVRIQYMREFPALLPKRVQNRPTSGVSTVAVTPVSSS